MVENPDSARIAAFLVLLRAKANPVYGILIQIFVQGETTEEIAGMADAMKEVSICVKIPYDVVDIVGTGGDGIGSVNISTGAAVIAAACGAKVAKHGNRSVSSQSGSADVLEALGIEIDLGPEGVVQCVDEAGIGFMFAPRYHPAMRHVRPVRSSLKMRTIFNILGPMLNPAQASFGLVGIYSPSLMKLMGNTLIRLSVKKALIVHSMGLDELTPLGPAKVLEVTQQHVKAYEIDPKDFGIPRCDVEDIKGGNAQTNAQLLLDVFNGASNPIADALNLNAGFALAACGVVSNPRDGVAFAKEIQQSGKPMHTLQTWIDVCKKAKENEMILAT